MEAEHFVGKISLRAIIERNDKIFICRGIGDKIWQLPGGRMHKNEDPKEGLTREILEELGVKVKVKNPTSAHHIVHTKTKVPQLVLVYVCKMGLEDEMVVDEKETEEIRWVSKEEAATVPMFEDCRAAVDVFLNIRPDRNA